jgi:Uncharacterized conserved protein
MNIVKKKGLIRIGTSNTTLPGNKTSFPPAFQSKSRLHYYASIFNTVEINSCFYKTPLRSTYEKWALDVPADFRFTLKLSKQITHTKELMFELSCMDNFIQAAHGTGDKKGCLLIQFPGKITLDDFEKVESILHKLQEHDPLNTWSKAVEFRNPSWNTGETIEMLDEFNAAMVLHDHPKAKNVNLHTKAGFMYLRYHGPKGNYRDSYTADFLRSQAAFIKEWAAKGKDVFAYFNNTIGNAFENALDLKAMLAE